MSFGLNELQAVLKDWPAVAHLPEKDGDSLMDRICQVLRVAQAGRNPKGWQADLQPLVRHALLRAGMEAGKVPRLRVPTDNGWPDRQSWSEHGFEVLEAGSSAYLLTPLSGIPSGLEAARAEYSQIRFPIAWSDGKTVARLIRLYGTRLVTKTIHPLASGKLCVPRF